MLQAAHRGDGQSVGTPDTCNTPTGATGTAPIAYTNTSLNAQASPFSSIVKICSQNALNLSSVVSSTSGDEAGTAHSSIKGVQNFTSGNAVVLIEGQPAITLTSPTAHNNMNCPSGTVTQPSTSVVLFTRRMAPRGVPGPGLERFDVSLSADELRRLAREACGPSDVRVVSTEGRWATIRVARVGPRLGSELRRVLLPLAAAGVETLTLDLRGNPGGSLSALRDALGVFVGPGLRAAALRWRCGSRTALRTRGPHAFGGRLRVLVDDKTASAAELFAELLARHGRASVHGGPTFGKRTVHVLRPAAEHGVAHYQAVGEIVPLS